MRTGWSHIRCVTRRDGFSLRLTFLVVLALGAAILEGAGIGFLIPVLENLQDANSGHMGMAGVSGGIARLFTILGLPYTLSVVLLAGLCLFAFQALLNYGRVHLSVRTRNKLVVELRSEAFTHLIGLDLAFFHRSRIGELVSTLVVETERAGKALWAMVEMLAALCLLVVYALLELMIDWKLALVALPVLGTVALLLRPRESYQLGLELSKENNELQSTAVETIGGIREVKALEVGKLSFQRFYRAASALARLDIALTERGARFGMLYQGAVIAGVVALVYFGSQWGGLALPSLLIFLLVLQRLAPRVSHFLEQRHWWLGSANAMEKVEFLLKEKATLTEAISSGHTPFNRLKKGIEVKDVHFRHVGQTVNTLSSVSFTVPRGTTVAIVGASGAGKSTLIDLLVRFCDPTEGFIRVDGCDLRELDIVSWRRAIGLMSQDAFLFNDTIESNMRCGDVNITMAAIEEAARRAHAHEFICQLPQGYATVIGDRGVKLSGGQRQRLALARALLRQPQMLILDEATNSLDSESERYIQEALHEIGLTCTVVVVAHRLSTIEHADMIIVLENGRVVEQGTYAELLACGGRFAKFHQLQCKGLSVPLGRS